jgi:outer membrane protein
MRTNISGFFTSVLVVCFMVVSAQAADVAKIGVIDFQTILKTSNAGKAAQVEINKQGKKMEADLKEKADELEDLKKKLEREALVMSQEMRDEKEREFRIKVGDFKMLEKKYKESFNEVNAKIGVRFREDIFSVAEKIGKTEGYLLIIEKNEAGVVYAPNTIDITYQVIKLYDADYAKKPADTKK